MSFDVELPKDVQPRWPNKCLGCGRLDPESHLTLWTHSIGWWTLVTFFFGRPFRADVPLCHSCRQSIRWQRWCRTIVIWGFVFLGAFIALKLLNGYHGAFKRWLVLLCVLPVILPSVLWPVIFPPPIDITAYAKNVEYEFKDAEFARGFAMLNLEHVKLTREV